MSTHGCTEQVVNELVSRLSGEVFVHNLKTEKNPDFSDSDRVIIGGSIHAGKIQSRVRKFCEDNLDRLLGKDVGLFICCMYEGEQANEQLVNAFPEKLHQHAKNEAIMGGEFNFEKMRFFEKLAVRHLAKVDHTVSKIRYEEITRFAGRMEKAIIPFIVLV